MKALLLAAVLLALVRSASAQLGVTSNGIQGKFYVSVDDEARLFLDGQPIHDAPINLSTSKEVTLRPGGRVVVQLRNVASGRRFKLAFLSTDGRWMVSFERRNYRILDETSLTDFTTADWGRWTKPAREERTQYKDGFPFKNNSEWVWGEKDQCTLAALVMTELIKPAAAAGGLGITALPKENRAVLTVEALVDGPSTLHVRRDGIFWVNGANAKPGEHGEPTYVNDKEWKPRWGWPDRRRGTDKTDVYPLNLSTLELNVELVSNMEKRGEDAVDPGRHPLETNRRPNELEIVVPDPEPGARWYKIVFRERKR